MTEGGQRRARPLDYARPDLRLARLRLLLSLLPRPKVPPPIGVACSILAVTCAVVAASFLPKWAVVRPGDPAWMGDVTPVAVWTGLACAVLGSGPRRAGSSAGRGMAVAALCVLLLCAGGLLILPRIIHCGEPAHRVQCAARLRQIGQAIAMYAADHGGVRPATLAELAPLDLSHELFICPLGDQVPLTMQQVRANPVVLNDPRYSAFTYVPPTTVFDQPGPNDVVAFEPVGHGDGGNVLFGNGRVEWAVERQLEQIRTDHAAGVRPLQLRP